jgi:hypothetical protein
MRSAESPTIEPPWTEARLAEELREGGAGLRWIGLRLLDSDVAHGDAPRADGVVEVDWLGRSARFVYEYRASSTPKALETAALQAESYARRTGLLPLVIVPYLSESALRTLEADRVSGVDLSGNGIILAPGMSLWRSGQPNRFREPAAIRNVFRGDSSIIARCFLLRREFQSLTELRQFALDRLHPGRSARSVDAGAVGTPRAEPTAALDEAAYALARRVTVAFDRAALTKGTVSKVVKALAEERIIAREGKASRLVAPGELMDRLRANMPATRRAGIRGRTNLATSEVWNRLGHSDLEYVATGEGSAAHYGLLSGPDCTSLYVDDLEDACKLLKVRPTGVFPNIELFEEDGHTVYFDTRIDGDARWASPVQVWLELSVAGPREREAAEMLATELAKERAEAQM